MDNSTAHFLSSSFSSSFSTAGIFDSAVLFEPSVISPEVKQITVLSRSLKAPPVQSEEGACYWIPENPENVWQDRDHQFAVFQNAAWHFFKAEKGVLVWIVDEADFRLWDGHNLVSTAMRVNPVTQLKSCLRSGVRKTMQAGGLLLNIRK